MNESLWAPPRSLDWPAEPVITSSQCYPVGISSPSPLSLRRLGPAGHVPPSPGPYPDQREGLQSFIISLIFLPFCFSHDISTVTRRREGCFQEVLGLVIKTHPGDSGSRPCQLGGSRKCLSPGGAVENRKNQEKRVGLKTIHHRLEMSQ